MGVKRKRITRRARGLELLFSRSGALIFLIGSAGEGSCMNSFVLFQITSPRKEVSGRSVGPKHSSARCQTGLVVSAVGRQWH